MLPFVKIKNLKWAFFSRTAYTFRCFETCILNSGHRLLWPPHEDLLAWQSLMYNLIIGHDSNMLRKISHSYVSSWMVLRKGFILLPNTLVLASLFAISFTLTFIFSIWLSLMTIGLRLIWTLSWTNWHWTHDTNSYMFRIIGILPWRNSCYHHHCTLHGRYYSL